MVAALVDGLRDDPDIEVLHVNARLSRNAADIGRWRIGKLAPLLAACGRAWLLQARHRPCVLYYVPAPGKRSALYRDLLVMFLCRAFSRTLVLHWHAAGLGEWLTHHAHPWERAISRALLGGAQLSIVLGDNLREDAATLNPSRIVVVRNGILDPCPGFTRAPQIKPGYLRAVFLGLCSREKGLFDAIDGVLEKNRRSVETGSKPVHLEVAGDFPDPETASQFDARVAGNEGVIRYVGFVQGAKKYELLANADVLLFPTRYPHETQGLVVAEALAFDLPIITTRWRAVHEGLPERHVYFAEPSRPEQIADALGAVEKKGSPEGALRRHFLSHCTRERHLARMRAALQGLS